jgi:hypothetical protein
MKNRNTDLFFIKVQTQSGRQLSMNRGSGGPVPGLVRMTAWRRFSRPILMELGGRAALRTIPGTERLPLKTPQFTDGRRHGDKKDCKEMLRFVMLMRPPFMNLLFLK